MHKLLGLQEMKRIILYFFLVSQLYADSKSFLKVEDCALDGDSISFLVSHHVVSWQFTHGIDRSLKKVWGVVRIRNFLKNPKPELAATAISTNLSDVFCDWKLGAENRMVGGRRKYMVCYQLSSPGSLVLPSFSESRIEFDRLEVLGNGSTIAVTKGAQVGFYNLNNFSSIVSGFNSQCLDALNKHALAGLERDRPQVFSSADAQAFVVRGRDVFTCDVYTCDDGNLKCQTSRHSIVGYPFGVAHFGRKTCLIFGSMENSGSTIVYGPDLETVYHTFAGEPIAFDPQLRFIVTSAKPYQTIGMSLNPDKMTMGVLVHDVANSKSIPITVDFEPAVIQLKALLKRKIATGN